MTVDQITAIQERVGTVPDGIWGAKSKLAVQRHLRRLMPSPPVWPIDITADITRFFGAPGDQRNLSNLDVSGLGMRYDGKEVSTVRCHRRVEQSLGEILREISASPNAWVLKSYAGCYAHRAMRGGTNLSRHSWGIAIDLAPETNGNQTPWPTKSNMPLEVMEIFARRGWLSAGGFWFRDAMHFQATI